MRALRSKVGSGVIVEIDGGHTIGGTISAVSRTDVTLEAAGLLDAGQNASIDGKVIIPTRRILWVQVL